MSKPVICHQTDNYTVIINPDAVSGPSLFVGPNGAEFYDNYHVIRNLDEDSYIVEYRAESLVAALSACEQMQDILTNRRYIHRDPFAEIEKALEQEGQYNVLSLVKDDQEDPGSKLN